MPGLDPGIHGVPASPAQPVKSQSSPRTDRRHQPNPVDARVKHGHDDEIYFLINNNANRTAVDLIRASAASQYHRPHPLKASPRQQPIDVISQTTWMPVSSTRLSGSMKIIKNNALPSCPDLIRASTASQHHRPNPLKASPRQEPIDVISQTPWMPVSSTGMTIRFTSLPTITRTGQPCVKHGHDDEICFLINNNANRTAVDQVRA